MATCRSCGHDIEWVTTEATGRPMPLDPGPDRERRVSHFATCPQADQHRRGRR
jgi:hypothetical protein